MFQALLRVIFYRFFWSLIAFLADILGLLVLVRWNIVRCMVLDGLVFLRLVFVPWRYISWTTFLGSGNWCGYSCVVDIYGPGIFRGMIFLGIRAC